jgi:4-phytase/acid phosphatase
MRALKDLRPSRPRAILFAALGAIAALSASAPARAATDPPGLQLERVVILQRHGLRAPLSGEAAESLARQPWPKWTTSQSYLTAHGREGMRLFGAYDRQLFASLGLLPKDGCPAPGQIAVWTNSVERTIASGQAVAEGLAPGCAIAIDHLPLDQRDPLFDPFESGQVSIDAPAAVAAINAETGGARKLAAPYGAQIRTVETILGCRGPGVAKPCDIAAEPAAISLSQDGKGVDLSGAINTTSGTAQVFLLEYLEGLPMSQVGWGRASLARITAISRLHALLFDVYARPTYMAKRVAGPLGRRLLAAIDGDPTAGKSAPAVALFVGHDNNIAAVTALLGVHFQLGGYGYDDPPVGGALVFEVLREPKSGQAYVRTLYMAQTPDQLRHLTALDLKHPPSTETLKVEACAAPGASLCTLEAFNALLGQRLAP